LKPELLGLLACDVQANNLAKNGRIIFAKKSKLAKADWSATPNTWEFGAVNRLGEDLVNHLAFWNFERLTA
jgi:hypothetical protein